MSTELVNSASIITFPVPCTLCESSGNVQKFAGLMLCGDCQENIKITNPSIFSIKGNIDAISYLSNKRTTKSKDSVLNKLLK